MGWARAVGYRYLACVAAYEPALISVMGEDDLAQTFGTMEQMGAAAAAGRLVDAVRAFAPWICADEEIAASEHTNYFERWAGGVPAMLRFVQHDGSYEGPRSTDPEALALITAPVLLLLGRQTRLDTFFTASARFIAQHVADPQVWELPGLGHFAPVLAPQSVAEELITFFESARQPAEPRPRRRDKPHSSAAASMIDWLGDRGVLGVLRYDDVTGGSSGLR